MFHNFQEMEDYIKSQNIKKRLVLANAHDEDVLEAVVTARTRGVIEPILIGKWGKWQKITLLFPARMRGKLPGWPAGW